MAPRGGGDDPEGDAFTGFSCPIDVSTFSTLLSSRALHAAQDVPDVDVDDDDVELTGDPVTDACRDAAAGEGIDVVLVVDVAPNSGALVFTSDDDGEHAPSTLHDAERAAMAAVASRVHD